MIGVNVGTWMFNVGRIRFTLGNGTFTTLGIRIIFYIKTLSILKTIFLTNFQILGKVTVGGIFHFIPGSAAEIAVVTDIEVLACQKCTNGGSGKNCSILVERKN